MSKTAPTYSLETIKAAVLMRGPEVFTLSSLTGIRAMGLTVADAVDIIQNLSGSHFYKTMPSTARPGEFQDVYHAPTFAGLAYVKFTLRQSGAIVISFKEK